MLRLSCLSVLVAGVAGWACAGQPQVYVPLQKASPKLQRCEEIDYGGCFGGSFVLSPTATYDNETGIYTSDSVAKAIVVQFSPDSADGALFDLDSLRIAAVWTGGAPRLIGWWLNGQHGPTSQLTQVPFVTTQGVGWAGPDGSFNDPRPDIVNPLPRPGPLPREWARIAGYYRHGRETVFRYTVGGTEVLEKLSLEKNAQGAALARTFNLAPHTQPLTVVLGDLPAAAVLVGAGGTVSEKDNRLVLTIPANPAPAQLKVLVGAATAKEALTALAGASAPAAELSALTRGGEGLWKETLTTKGTLGDAAAPYAVDSVGLPETNPWKAWMRPSGFDFLDATRAALATLNGDLFTVSGLDEKLEKVEWRRFAAGLHAPLGVKVVKGEIFVACRDGIYRLHDLNKDGEADYYELFNTDLLQTPSFHSFVCDLHTDANGNFYFSVGGAIRAGGRGFQRLTPHQGVVLRLSADGQKLEVIATGCRMPNGSAVRPDGQMTVSDNEGVWVPASPIHWVKEGSFLSCVSTAHGRETHPPQPLTFMPQRVDSSACSQVWVDSDRWGPFKDELLHLSYGKAGVFLVYKNEVEGVMQGGVVRMPLKLTSSGLRGRFNPADGQLYVCGLRMNQTTAVKDGGFDRIRYTGKPVYQPRNMEILNNGVRLTFTQPLDPKSADVQNFGVARWNYRWTAGYGSQFFSVADPNKSTPTGDEVPVKKVTLSPDRRSVFLEIDGLIPVMQFSVKCKVNAEDGTPIDSEAIGTIHKVPAIKG